MNLITRHRRLTAVAAGVLGLPVVVGVALPGVASAASGTSASTLQASIGGNGAVQSTKQVASNGSSSAYHGTLPLKLGITSTKSGSATTYTYTVTNTDSQQKTVHYTDTAGKHHSASVTLQLPLVAILGVVVPKGTQVATTGTNVTSITGPDGSHHLLWQLVMFSPLGSPTQTETFTTTGSGTPVAELQARAVDPTATQGLSQSGQDATANITQDDFWSSYISGGASGLNQLSDGTTKLISGLEQLQAGADTLHNGLATAGSGAVKLDNGTRAAKNGADSLSAGLTKLHNGQGSLTNGLKKIHAGQGTLSGGLSQLKGGLGQLNGGAGLPLVVSVLNALDNGVGQLIAGVGESPTDTGTLRNGLALVGGGIQSVIDDTTLLDGGLQCFEAGLSYAADGGAVPPAACGTFPAVTTTISETENRQAINQVLGSIQTTEATVAHSLQPASANPGGLPALLAGVEAVQCGLSNEGCGNAPAGVLQGLDSVKGGLDELTDPKTGLPSAVAGVTKLENGAAAALAGSEQLVAGSGSALAGSEKLTAGSGKAAAGSQTLASGLGQLSAGQHKVATGLPAAIIGSGEIATNLTKVVGGVQQVKGGIGQVKSGATTPLGKQFKEGSRNAHETVAELQATGALASSSPGGAGTSYVLTQDPKELQLDADSSSAGSSHTGRNVGLGIGALILLVLALVGGLLLGRRSGGAAGAA